MKHWKACYKVHPQKRKKKSSKETKAMDSKAVTRLQTTLSTMFHDSKFLTLESPRGAHLLRVRYKENMPDRLRIDEWPRDKYSVSNHWNVDMAYDICLSLKVSVFPYFSLSLSRTRNVLGSCCEMWVGRDLTWNKNFHNKKIRKKKAWMKLIIIYSFPKILNENEFRLLVSFKHFFFVRLLKKFLFQVRETEGERELERGWQVS